jgi:Na+-translocating ferredoxin:NAD+ oxidoreductase RnfG subunit
MKRKTIIVLILFIAAIIVALVVWKWTFKKSDVSMASQKADVEIEADILTQEYENNEEAANAKYLGKVIVVSGIISSLNEEEQGLSVYLKKSEAMSGVMCTFSKDEVDATRIKVGNKIKIKGICDGYLMDVKLNKCSLEK